MRKGPQKGAYSVYRIQKKNAHYLFLNSNSVTRINTENKNYSFSNPNSWISYAVSVLGVSETLVVDVADGALSHSEFFG